jgi:hypothetical protein
MPGETIKTEKEKYIEYLGLYKHYSNTLLKAKLKINDNILAKFLTKAIIQYRVEASEPKVRSEKVPFSENELHYGTNNTIKWPKKYENSPIKKRKMSELALAIKNYKKIVYDVK